MRRGVGLAAALLAVGGTGALPGTAGAVIVPGKGMLGVEIGMTAERVLKVAPNPSSTITDRGGETRYTYKKQGVRVRFHVNRSGTHWVVAGVSTDRGAERTAEGVGVGTAERTLRAKLAGEHCRTFHNVNGRQCWLGPYTDGSITTVFGISKRTRRVTWVAVNRISE